VRPHRRGRAQESGTASHLIPSVASSATMYVLEPLSSRLGALHRALDHGGIPRRLCSRHLLECAPVRDQVLEPGDDLRGQHEEGRGLSAVFSHGPYVAHRDSLLENP
jgi:hypothetical protein